MSAPLIELTDVSFAYGAVPALRTINLDIYPGDYVGVIGPNGGGKTTLLKVMLGLLTPQHGAVKLLGESIQKFRDWSKIGYVAQHSTAQESKAPMTVEEVVALGRVSGLGLFRFMRANDKKAVAAALRKVDMWPLRHRLISELSGGQQQRVYIAKALAAEPEVLILDEPTVGIDIKSQDEFYQLLARLNKNEQLTLVLVSHDVDVVVNEVTKVACINQTLIYHGAPQQFIEGEYMAHLYGKGRKFILHGH